MEERVGVIWAGAEYGEYRAGRQGWLFQLCRSSITEYEIMLEGLHSEPIAER